MPLVPRGVGEAGELGVDLARVADELQALRGLVRVGRARDLAVLGDEGHRQRIVVRVSDREVRQRRGHPPADRHVVQCQAVQGRRGVGGRAEPQGSPGREQLAAVFQAHLKEVQPALVHLDRGRGELGVDLLRRADELDPVGLPVRIGEPDQLDRPGNDRQHQGVPVRVRDGEIRQVHRPPRRHGRWAVGVVQPREGRRGVAARGGHHDDARGRQGAVAHGDVDPGQVVAAVGGEGHAGQQGGEFGCRPAQLDSGDIRVRVRQSADHAVVAGQGRQQRIVVEVLDHRVEHLDLDAGRRLRLRDDRHEDAGGAVAGGRVAALPVPGALAARGDVVHQRSGGDVDPVGDRDVDPGEPFRIRREGEPGELAVEVRRRPPQLDARHCRILVRHPADEAEAGRKRHLQEVAVGVAHGQVRGLHRRARRGRRPGPGHALERGRGVGGEQAGIGLEGGRHERHRRAAGVAVRGDVEVPVPAKPGASGRRGRRRDPGAHRLGQRRDERPPLGPGPRPAAVDQHLAGGPQGLPEGGQVAGPRPEPGPVQAQRPQRQRSGFAMGDQVDGLQAAARAQGLGDAGQTVVRLRQDLDLHAFAQAGEQHLDVRHVGQDEQQFGVVGRRASRRGVMRHGSPRNGRSGPSPLSRGRGRGSGRAPRIGGFGRRGAPEWGARPPR
ncbi:hypothetical protein PHZ_c2163 [Phenylobacterium zucineum HLK1]|uniref:Uncharacterized protein n=1 Tax=Phenylobacterium zucineum (strain HLK1) TaxID=450851 RepID=B4REP8_PHEZH|nr:hypothetical protein PHZ_c2163 [Phenylobacterium zucineum HLK1]